MRFFERATLTEDVGISHRQIARILVPKIDIILSKSAPFDRAILYIPIIIGKDVNLNYKNNIRYQDRYSMAKIQSIIDHENWLNMSLTERVDKYKAGLVNGVGVLRREFCTIQQRIRIINVVESVSL